MWEIEAWDYDGESFETVFRSDKESAARDMFADTTAVDALAIALGITVGGRRLLMAGVVMETYGV